MTNIPVAIIGGGLSGLYAAYLLEKQGIDYVLIEARPTLGGRILDNRLLQDSNPEQTTSQYLGSNNAQDVDSFDLGPSWFWPEFQPQLSALVDELELETFAQFEEGDTLIERAPNEPAMRTLGYKSSPPSMRIKGGMKALIDALYHRLDPLKVVTGQRVKSLDYTDDVARITSEDRVGQVKTWQAKQVLLALPPRLIEASITFEPKLPTDLRDEWRNTATWMAPHAKYFAIYDTPFWRRHGLSGAARSSQGPMVEIHDASIMDGSGALFGFVGVPASVRQSVSTEVLKEHCRAQLVRLFGEQAGAPKSEYLKDWAQDSFTATLADASSNGQHPQAPQSQPISGIWADSLTGIGSEWSPRFSGYLAGAVEAASLGVQSLPKGL